MDNNTKSKAGVDFAKLNGGEALAKLNEMLNDLVKSCMDTQTPASAKRELTLKISVIPDKKRETCDVLLAWDRKLPKEAPQETSFVIVTKKDGFHFAEKVGRQEELFVGHGAEQELKPH